MRWTFICGSSWTFDSETHAKIVTGAALLHVHPYMDQRSDRSSTVDGPSITQGTTYCADIASHEGKA